MDYEKKYKEAIERMKSWAKGEHPECFSEPQKTAEFIFPELKESKDERIRREIIDFLRLPHPQFVGKRDHEKWIAWLDKQDEPKESEEEKNKNIRTGLIKAFNTVGTYTWGGINVQDILEWLENIKTDVRR